MHYLYYNIDEFASSAWRWSDQSPGNWWLESHGKPPQEESDAHKGRNSSRAGDYSGRVLPSPRQDRGFRGEGVGASGNLS